MTMNWKTFNQQNTTGPLLNNYHSFFHLFANQYMYMTESDVNLAQHCSLLIMIKIQVNMYVNESETF